MSPASSWEVVGVLGGTFDPIHFGHLHAAERVRAALRFRRVLLVPCALPPHKTSARITAVVHRLAMARLAARDCPWLEVSTVELERGGRSYTIETLRELASTHPHSAPVFILGTDALLELPLWHDHESLVREFDLVAVDRPGDRLEEIREALDPYLRDRLVPVPGGVPQRGLPPGAGGRIYHLPIPPCPVSSSQVREKAALGDRLDGLVPAAVARYIQHEKLYRQEATC